MTSVPLASLTTSRVGGPARRYINAETEDELIGAVRAADEAKEPLLIVGGGSNLLISDAGFDGAVVHVATLGLDLNANTDGTVTVRAQAGHPWDEVVAQTLREGCSGLEALSGIPGLAGATPVQNVGAYGADVSHSITGVRAWDRQDRAIVSFGNEDLQFGYRDSVLKRSTVNGSPRYVVLTVDFGLTRGMESAPVRYAELARALNVQVGERAPADDVRREVLRLRAGKGMVLDASDPDTYSTGSFFTNPVVSEEAAAHLPPDAPRYPVSQPGMVKLSAAWLIDRSGFPKGFGLPSTGQGTELAGGRASLSTKHTLAVTNRGNATAEDLLAVARAVADGVEAAFGIRLHPEPLLINCSL
ncbi:UDP-N-acetylmuramate dehydrogenase [Arthrobacter sp. zg-Y820]|uniref:UDP-N-acetylmuramate dehydrogenase n=1 Tax=unclassified Arthrobacter TaxID=235627 RepID=UPI001E408816|nr:MULTISPECIES: UDP-N-acetylmuramate dehydrogenase [unclassified Arthrobacter]MCC9195747.1 UDP-N-acetylmuramate dehydrogenase [Arthrobacter sp. zg-Y820]MDK1278606.1 UDP-N-acetylmuramate dehydrogenase [Arthrobacter sp. zg.Y820]WIB11185.1 UDP-N-acetylmuramate dehydrogenase [Arthrobacter sp. zg-Y820]